MVFPFRNEYCVVLRISLANTVEKIGVLQSLNSDFGSDFNVAVYWLNFWKHEFLHL